MDKDFTAKAMSCERDYELFKKIIEMVHSIGIHICVEGIEKEDWHLKMKELQADYLQGYFLENPVKKRSLWKSLFVIRIIMAYGEIVPLRRCYFTIQIFYRNFHICMKRSIKNERNRSYLEVFR